MSLSPRLTTYLQQSGAQYQVCMHAHSRTSAETARMAHVPEHQLAKSVILEDERGCVLAVVPADARVQVGAVARMLGRSSLRLSDETKIGTVFDEQPHDGEIAALGGKVNGKRVVTLIPDVRVGAAIEQRFHHCFVADAEM